MCPNDFNVARDITSAYADWLHLSITINRILCLIQIELDHHCRITHVCFVQTIDFEYLVANLDCVGIVIFKWRYYAGFVMISCGIRVWERNTVIVVSIQTTATYMALFMLRATHLVIFLFSVLAVKNTYYFIRTKHFIGY